MMRFPRPHRLRRVSVCSLSRQLGVSEPTAYDLAHRQRETVFIGQRIVLRCAIVVPEDLFSDVPIKVEGLNRNIGAAQPSLEQAPEILDPLSVNLSADVLIHMVHRLMYKLHVAERLVIGQPIAVDGRSLFDVAKNSFHEHFALHFGDDMGAHLPRFAVPRSSIPNTAVFLVARPQTCGT